MGTVANSCERHLGIWGEKSSIIVLFVQDFPLCPFAKKMFYKRGQPLYITSKNKKKKKKQKQQQHNSTNGIERFAKLTVPGASFPGVAHV